jgi:succinate dehydrogenase / fumarate reductase cytochrome b subunit
MRQRIRALGSVGLKTGMAITGLILFAFVVFHLSNNLHIYLGREIYNTEGFAWKTPAVITIARPVLLVSVTLHAIGGVTLLVMNRRARPQRYIVQKYQVATLYGRAMIITGVVTAAYIAYHVLHAKVGSAHPSLFDMLDGEGRRDVYNIIVVSFQQPGIAAAYLLGLAGLFLHTAHGVTSVFSTLGVLRDKNRRLLERVGPVLSILLFIGYASIPFCALAGLLDPKL